MKFDMAIRWPLDHHQDIINEQRVLDLACHSGISSIMMADLGARFVTGVDIRSDLIAQAQSNTYPNTKFLCTDITDIAFLDQQVPNHDIVTAFGVLYHMFDHFRFLKNIMRPNVRYVILETLHGPESSMPSMFWAVEDTAPFVNGWDPDLSRIMHGTPNLSWLISAAEIFGFRCDYVHRRYLTTRFDRITNHDNNQRMVVRFFNNAIIDKKHFTIDDVWRWNDNNLLQQVDQT